LIKVGHIEHNVTVMAEITNDFANSGSAETYSALTTMVTNGSQLEDLHQGIERRVHRPGQSAQHPERDRHQCGQHESCENGLQAGHDLIEEGRRAGVAAELHLGVRILRQDGGVAPLLAFVEGALLGAGGDMVAPQAVGLPPDLDRPGQDAEAGLHQRRQHAPRREKQDDRGQWDAQHAPQFRELRPRRLARDHAQDRRAPAEPEDVEIARDTRQAGLPAFPPRAVRRVVTNGWRRGEIAHRGHGRVLERLI
jgi:hypothetical protein